MDDVRGELLALRRRVRLQAIAGVGTIAIFCMALGGAEATARILAESDAYAVKTKNSSGALTVRWIATSEVDTARLKVRDANIELFPQSTLPGTSAAGAIAWSSSDSKFKVFNGTSWVEPGGGSSITRIVVDKPSDESVTSSTTFQADDHLTFAVGASETWEADLWLNASAGSGTADIKYRFNAPAGATVKYWVVGSDTGTNPTNNVGCFYATGIGGTGVSSGLANVTNAGNLIHVVVANSTTPGSVTLEWAQNTSKPAATTVRSGSRLVATKF